MTLCLGCTCVGAGLLCATIIGGLLVLTHRSVIFCVSLWPLEALGVLLYLPTLGQLWIQWKPYKIVSRFSLGLGLFTLWLPAMALLPFNAVGAGLRLLFIAIFFAVYFITQRVRSTRLQKRCVGCAEGAYPFCKDYLNRRAELIAKLRFESDPSDRPFVDFITALAEGSDPQCRAMGIGQVNPEPNER